jgi:hypothetical protein
MMPRRLVFAVAATLFGVAAWAQTPVYPGGCETLATQRTSDAGCYLNAVAPMESMSEPVFWHLYTYPTIEAGPGCARQERHSSPGLQQVLDLRAGEGGLASRERRACCGYWTTADRTRCALHGALHGIDPAAWSGVRSTHTHSGPEAFYILSGAQCLETPNATTVSRAGESTIVGAGPPMAVSAVGTEVRRAVFLVLYNSAHPWMTRESTWSPPGRCHH